MMCNVIQPGSQFGEIITDNDIWLSQKAIAQILASNVRSINDIVRDLEMSGFNSISREFLIFQQEGERQIKRRIKHYNFEIVHAVALRSNRLDKLTALMERAHRLGVLKPRYLVPGRKELQFGDMISAVLQGITPVQRQFPIDGFFADFYLPTLNIVVEFDERHHMRSSNSLKDQDRQQAIETMIGAVFIRVAEGDEWNALNQIIRAILASNQKEP